MASARPEIQLAMHLLVRFSENPKMSFHRNERRDLLHQLDPGDGKTLRGSVMNTKFMMDSQISAVNHVNSCCAYLALLKT